MPFRARRIQQPSAFPGIHQQLIGGILRAATLREFIQAQAEPRAGTTTAHPEDGLLISLSARVMEVLALITEGKSNQEISTELYLALNTVKRYAYNKFVKLEVKKRTQAVSKTRQLGLIPEIPLRNSTYIAPWIHDSLYPGGYLIHILTS